MSKLRVGLALTGSYCTYAEAIAAFRAICEKYDVTPIMSETSYATDSRFGDAAGFIGALEEMTGKKVISTITGAEPIGPKKLLDVVIIAPCTGNTLAKLANGITDTCVTMAAKAVLSQRQLQAVKPLVVEYQCFHRPIVFYLLLFSAYLSAQIQKDYQRRSLL